MERMERGGTVIHQFGSAGIKVSRGSFCSDFGLKPGKPALLFAFITISFAANSRSFLSAANNCIIQTDKTQCFLSLTLDPHGSQRESATGVEKINADKRKQWVKPGKQITPVYQNVIVETMKLTASAAHVDKCRQPCAAKNVLEQHLLLAGELFSGASFSDSDFVGASQRTRWGGKHVRALGNREYPFSRPNVICLLWNEISVIILFVNINEWFSCAGAWRIVHPTVCHCSVLQF